jgi:hypothetical protein
MIYRILKKILTPRYGKKKFQPLFEILYDMSLTGMNIGGGTDPGDSGELNALHYIKGKLDSLKDSGDYTIFDVGANIGKYALLLNDVFGTLYSNTDESGLASVYKRNLEHFNIDMNQSEEIEIKNLDSFCKEKNINHIHFLKLDVEGHEKKVIEGAKRMIDAGEVDFIQFEFGGCNIDSRTYFQDFYYLLNERYQIYRIVRDGIFPVGKYGERYESFLTTNYLAEKRGL